MAYCQQRIILTKHLLTLLKEYEDRQLLWEQHEVELERKIAKLENQQKDFYEAAKKVIFDNRIFEHLKSMATERFCVRAIISNMTDPSSEVLLFRPFSHLFAFKQ